MPRDLFESAQTAFSGGFGVVADAALEFLDVASQGCVVDGDLVSDRVVFDVVCLRPELRKYVTVAHDRRTRSCISVRTLRAHMDAGNRLILEVETQNAHVQLELCHFIADMRKSVLSLLRWDVAIRASSFVVKPQHHPAALDHYMLPPIVGECIASSSSSSSSSTALVPIAMPLPGDFESKSVMGILIKANAFGDRPECSVLVDTLPPHC